MTASTESVPGQLKEDAEDLYRVMGMIASDLAGEIAVSDYYVGGYSLGGAYTAFVSLLDSKQRRLDFKKAVVINPAVSLYNSVNRLDQMVADNIAEDREGVTRFIDRLFDQIVALYNSSDQVDFADPAFLYRAYATLEPPERELELLIGLAFRLTSNDMAFTSDVMTNAAYVVPRNAQLTATTSLTDVMLEGLRLNFVDFFDGLYVPSVLRREPGVTRAELVARESLRRDRALSATGFARCHARDPGRRHPLPRRSVLARERLRRAGADLPDGRALRQHGSARVRARDAAADLRCRGALVRLRALAALALTAALGACAATPTYELGTAPPLHQLSPEERDGDLPLRIYDPWEGTNRGVYKFNALFDEYLFLPVVRAYEFVTPVFIEERVTDFFSNLGEFRNAGNGLMQARPDAAGRAVIRLSLNSTIGVLGLFDAASPMGVTQEPLDFGLTLGRWGTPNGPFLMVPVLGPSNVRDFSGFVVDTAIASYVPPESIVTEWVFFNPAIYVLYAVDLRRQVNFRYHDSGSPFEYDLIRFLYTKKRELQLRSLLGQVPTDIEPSPFRGPVDVAPISGSTLPHQAPAGRLLP